MLNTPLSADPFAMLVAPEQVMRAIERSDRLQRLQRRVYRPLDRPWIPHRATVGQPQDLSPESDDQDD
ncbi:MAG: hypothetical protein E6Q67_14630 [Roseateles sp.]|nr:MAG: hypothetical protein E6Q67_14630 [Roseateles sp.]